jgi:hypothetical protein
MAHPKVMSPRKMAAGSWVREVQENGGVKGDRVQEVQENGGVK